MLFISDSKKKDILIKILNQVFLPFNVIVSKNWKKTKRNIVSTVSLSILGSKEFFLPRMPFDIQIIDTKWNTSTHRQRYSPYHVGIHLIEQFL